RLEVEPGGAERREILRHRDLDDFRGHDGVQRIGTGLGRQSGGREREQRGNRWFVEKHLGPWVQPRTPRMAAAAVHDIISARPSTMLSIEAMFRDAQV